MLIVHAHPIAQPLSSLLERLVQPRLLVRGENPGNSIFAAGQNSFGLAKIQRASIRQLIINLLQDRPDFLVLVRREIHFGPPALRRAAEPAERVALAPHFILGRPHDEKCARYRARNKTCENEESDFPSTCRVHA